MGEAVPSKPNGAAQRELIVAGAISLVAVILHLLFLTHAGGLWRDEANTAQVATLPSVGELWHELTHDSFPALYPLLLRVWTVIGLGGTDFGLRCFGCLVGFAMIGAAWRTARDFGLRAPLITLSLIACNLAFVRWGDSLRAYGLGCGLIILAVGRVWAFVQQPNARQFAIASFVALLCVQCLFQSAFLVAAVCVAASIVGFRRGRNQMGWGALLIGLPAALSLLPYLGPIRESQKWFIVEKTGFNGPLAWHTFSTAMDTPMFVGSVIWIGLLLFAIFVGMALLEKRASRRDDLAGDLPLFGATAALAGGMGFFIFAVLAGLPTQPWYWLLLLAFFAVCIEAALGKRLARVGQWLVIGSASISALSAVTTLTQINCRMTRMDEAARHLTQQAGPEDLIVVYPWYNGVSFHRYYKGKVPWTTVPELSDHQVHRYDLLKEKLQEIDPLQPILERVQRVMNAGGTIWLVGSLPPPAPGEIEPPRLPPAPESPTGWFDEPYTYVWGRQFEYFLRNRAREATLVSVGTAGCYSIYEDVPLIKILGFPSMSSPQTEATK
jgi:hypothetical protein